MMKSVFILSLLLFCIGCTEEPSIIFEENFEGISLNQEFWNYDLGDGCPKLCGWGNNEEQIYTKKNVILRDGYLVITATRNDSLYESGRITTKGKVEFEYGMIEVRAKLATGNGLWPAIWMLGGDIDKKEWPLCGEIDIMEYIGKEPHTIYTSLHTFDSFGNNANSKKTTIENIEEGFHVYKADWNAERISFYIDDVLVYSFDPVEKNEKNWPFNKPFYLLLNLAIGGDFGGPEVDNTIFPKEFIIDYIKIFKH